MKMYHLFKRHSKEKHANSISAYLPNDITFEAKNIPGTTLRNFLVGLGVQLRKVEDKLNQFTHELGPDGAEFLLSNWESALSIPDHCFTNTDTIENRRRNVLVKLAKMNAQTGDQMEAVGLAMGFTITVLSGYDAIRPPYNFVIPEISNDYEARFTIVVLYPGSAIVYPTFTLTFPILFGYASANFAALQCALEQIKPANCQLIFREE